MAANDQIKHAAQILRQTRARERFLVVGAQDYNDLTQTDPKTQVYINGLANASGRPAIRAPQAFFPGERVIVQVKTRMGSNKTLDSTGSTSGVFVLQVAKRDLTTGALSYVTLSEADRSTAELADDPTLPDGVFADEYHFVVPDGEKWQLWGRWQQDLRTTA